MAKQKYIKKLKQGVDEWNLWREDNQRLGHDLSGADLRNADLRGINLSDANLSNADLRDARLRYADLSDANLSDADLSNTDLRNVDLRDTNLHNTSLSGAKVGWTIFGGVDLRSVKGLETVVHHSPSTIGTDTIERSAGSIPVEFLRGAGLSETFITYTRSLINQPINYYTCFISYSSKDQDFAEQLLADLQNNGVRCWFAPEDMDIGDKIRSRIEESINMYDKLLLILSEHSVASNWVAYEVERALNKEPKGVPNVLFPIRLDNAMLQCNAVWVDDIRSTRHIGDFGNWKNQDEYQKAFSKLLRALKA